MTAIYGDSIKTDGEFWRVSKNGDVIAEGVGNLKLKICNTATKYYVFSDGKIEIHIKEVME